MVRVLPSVVVMAVVMVVVRRARCLLQTPWRRR
jgi:hypothetical protein